MIPNPNLIIETILPIPTEHMRKYLENKDIRFQYDLSQSKITEPKVQLTFLANAGMPGMIDFNRLDKEQIKALLKEWITLKLMVDIEPLPNVLAKIILQALEIENKIPIPANVTEEIMEEFLTENKELIRDWVAFIDSALFVYLPHSMKQKEDLEVPYDDQFPIMDERDYFSLNIATLFQVPGFVTSFLTVSPSLDSLFYFKPQFEDYMFKGQKLLPYLLSPCNNEALMVLTTLFDIKELEKGNG